LEKQLKDIEKERTPASFINNMKKMIAVLVDEVRSESRRANISHI
jgi:DNA topoisomerase-3